MCLHNAGILASAQNIQDILGSGDEELPYGATPARQMCLTFSILSKYLNGIFFRNRIDVIIRGENYGNNFRYSQN
jgi:hypothetical protein